ncbi:MAG: DUF1559 domain-containing protein [Planctomycetes bacterium]|nr:DUF1559 domain-containing protein [Planctomycetota bacterium]
MKSLKSSAARARSAYNLKQIGLRIHNYRDSHENFPAPANYDADGKPLLSWRVHILQYMRGHERLYDQFHLNEPWDSEANQKLIERMPGVFRSPGTRLQEKGLTSYVLPVGPDTVFPGAEGPVPEQIKNWRTAIMAVEVDDAHAVIWTKPEDLSFDPQRPLQGLDGPFDGGFHAMFCSGLVKFQELTQDLDTIRSLFTARR